MGVRYLKDFIRSHDGLLIRDHRLHDTTIVVDACNLTATLLNVSQQKGSKEERRDLFGGDMVQYGQCISSFFDNLLECNIKPVLVFDGAQTHDVNTSKTKEKKRRAYKRYENVMQINKVGFGDFVLPAIATNTFRSVAVDKGIEIVQCMFEADLEVARLSNELQCPALSNDSDFYLFDLPHGLIPTDELKFKRVQKHSEDGIEYSYLTCCLFNQEHLGQYFPNLDKKSLPLLGVLMGNDFTRPKEFEAICAQLPLQVVSERIGLDFKEFRRVTNWHQQKILKILCFICDKSLNQTINQLCLHVPKQDRLDLKDRIKSYLTVYEVPTEDDFETELSKWCRSGFFHIHKDDFDNKKDLELEFKKNLKLIKDWLKRSMEQSVMTNRLLELAQKNNIFLRSVMDDSNLDSAHLCQLRFLRVIIGLLRCSRYDIKPVVLHDRMKDQQGRNIYGKTKITRLTELENFGPLDYFIWDVPHLSLDIRKSILLSTFYSTPETFDKLFASCREWFEPQHTAEYLTITILMDYIDIESPTAKLWGQFRDATLLCALYHFYTISNDSVLKNKLDEDENHKEFIDELLHVIKQQKYDKIPTLAGGCVYNQRLMHQINQLQVSIISFNFLNAFLGDVMTRIRTEGWLNSCLIYNLAEKLRRKTLELPKMPAIVHLPNDLLPT